MKALAIVNLSTLDAYTDHYGEEKGAKFAYKLYEKIVGFKGPVYIVEQETILTKNSNPRVALKRSLFPLLLRKDIHFITFEDNKEDWPHFLVGFLERLLEDGVDELVIGGLWDDPKLEVGAVAEAYKYFNQTIPTTVDPSISAPFPEKKKAK